MSNQPIVTGGKNGDQESRVDTLSFARYSVCDPGQAPSHQASLSSLQNDGVGPHTLEAPRRFQSLCS